jgi:MOSC domain-containing protein YiiM
VRAAIEIVSVNVGRPRSLTVKGRERVTGIFKEPITSRVAVRGDSVGDDVQMDKQHHGGPFQAVYVYALEDYEWWSRELKLDLVPGTFGENLTTRGIDLSLARVGERWRVGTVELVVTSPRIPCSTLASRMEQPGFVKRFAAAERFGAYCQIAGSGDIGMGDALEVLHRPDHGVTVVDVARVHYSKDPVESLRIFEATGGPEFLAHLAEVS